MLLNVYEPWKFAFSQEETDLNNVCENSWGILGIPFDSTSSYKTGSRTGPTVVREASFGFEKYNLELETELDTTFYDFGDINTIPGNCQKTCEIIEDTVKELLDNKIKPLIIGGEHSVTIGAIKAISQQYDNLTIIHLDAHRDLADEFIGEKYSHASVMKRVHEMGVKNLVQIGIRSSSKEEEEFVKSQDNIYSFKPKFVYDHYDELQYTLSQIEGPIYISIDLDVLDSSVAPKVGNPTPNGIFLHEIRYILKCINLDNVVGFDVVETATAELGDITAVAASKIIYDFLSLI